VTASGSAFAPSTAITISFDGAAVTTSPSPCMSSSSGKTGGGGAFTCSFHAPTGSAGPNTVSATDGTSTATATFYEKDLVSSSPNSVDVGQNATASGDGFGAWLAITTFTLGGIPLNCTSATNGSCTEGSITTNGSGGFTVTFLAPSVSASGQYTIDANDSAGTARNGTVSVYLDPQVGNLTASVPSADTGQTVTFSAAVSLGSGGYTYVWSGLPGCSGASDPLRCTTTSAGVATISLAATDSNGFLVTTKPLSFTVHDDPTVTAPNATAASVDVNQSVTFNTTAALGTGVYSSYNWTGLPAGCRGTTASVVCVPKAAGAVVVSVRVTDSDGGTSASSSGLAFTVYSTPTVLTPQANRSSADVGQVVTFSDAAAHGSGGFSYAWTGLPAGCGGTTQVVCTMTSAGLLVVRLGVTDSNGYEVTSPALSFIVYALPTVTVTATSLGVDAGQHVVFTATASGGSGGILYAWTGLPTGCSGATATVSCSTQTPASYSVTVRVRDSNGGDGTSSPVVLVVAAPLSVGAPSVSAAPTAGQAVTFSSAASGGTAPVSYAWTFGDGSTATGPTVEHIYAAVGTYPVVLYVNDSAGASVQKTAHVTVAAAPLPAPKNASSTAALPLLPIAAVAVVVVAVLALVAVLMRKRKGRAAPVGPSAGAQAPEGGTEPAPQDGKSDSGRS
jgi:hypothetical protein